ncbi:glycogen/starch/alpha-glucan phosphorylase [Chloroflexia bacterium SDU3-3]|nr:glycogen/starch/alpha-glucan phosphorylase [Chloroflexia bacterium SDU3-3]
MTAQREVHTRTGMTVDTFKRAFLDNLAYLQGKDISFATPNDQYMALSYTVRDRLIQRWLKTLHTYAAANAKTIYYLSAEYLLGRQLENALLNTGLTETAKQAMAELGLNMDEIAAQEAEPGLGNGGLGRLAACFLDSLATLKMPSIGYGIRYEYGIFQQSFQDGWQTEHPDEWLKRGNPWEFPHPDTEIEIGFGGTVESYTDEFGRLRRRWKHARSVLGVPYNMMVPGYRTGNVNTLRLWSAKANHSFNLQSFNAGDYERAVEDKTRSENISKVLYPEDSTPQGKQLRLEQQYFFVACSLADILRAPAAQGDFDRLPDRAAIQLNDTHPTIGIAEMMRLLVDVHGLDWDRAWKITQGTFAYTCHTLMPEALEKWSVSLFERLLPRHLEIIYQINERFLAEVRARFPGDGDRLRRMSIIEEGGERQVRMAHLAAVGSYSINGVAALHTRLLQETVLNDFYDLWPHKFNNKTNGVTPRRFMRLANPRLASLLSETIGDEWLTDLDQLRKLEPLADDPAFRAEWWRIKQANKVELAAIIQQRTGILVNPDSIFDIMVKRLHEYKRQHLKLLHVITLYNRLKADPEASVTPRVVIFGAKAAPGYRMAKLIIKLINNVAQIINNDPDIRGMLKVVFLPNYNVSLAEKIYPAADLSEQISMAGKEASGTSNMKFALNGALTTGTLDGANVEIRDMVGEENFFLFGLSTEEVFEHKAKGYWPRGYYERNGELRQAIDQIASGFFSNGDSSLFRPIVDHLLNEDTYMLMADYESYIRCQDVAEQAYRDGESWVRKSIINAARCGFFSSDRSMQQYCDEIWKIAPVEAELGLGEAEQQVEAEQANRALRTSFTPTSEDMYQFRRAAALIGIAMMHTTEGSLTDTMQEGEMILSILRSAGRKFPANTLLRTMLQGSTGKSLSIEQLISMQKGTDASVLRAEALAACRQVAEQLGQRATAQQAAELKRWLLLVGERVANAANEGSFWGLGGTKMSLEEQSFLAEVTTALGI